MYETVQTANAILKIKSTEEIPFSESPTGPKLTKNNSVLAYEGDLVGVGILEELKVHFGPKNAVMQGLQRFTGKLFDRTGSFVLKYEGRSVNGMISSKMTVVPASATEGLKGLRGEMTVQGTSGSNFTVTFTYHFA
jgi:hypothetical protein